MPQICLQDDAPTNCFYSLLFGGPASRRPCRPLRQGNFAASGRIRRVQVSCGAVLATDERPRRAPRRHRTGAPVNFEHVCVQPGKRLAPGGAAHAGFIRRPAGGDRGRGSPWVQSASAGRGAASAPVVPTAIISHAQSRSPNAQRDPVLREGHGANQPAPSPDPPAKAATAKSDISVQEGAAASHRSPRPALSPTTAAPRHSRRATAAASVRRRIGAWVSQ